MVNVNVNGLLLWPLFLPSPPPPLQNVKLSNTLVL